MYVGLNPTIICAFIFVHLCQHIYILFYCFEIMECIDTEDAYAFKTYTILLKLEIITLTNQIKSLTLENKTLKHFLARDVYDAIDTIDKNEEKNDDTIN